MLPIPLILACSGARSIAVSVRKSPAGITCLHSACWLRRSHYTKAPPPKDFQSDSPPESNPFLAFPNCAVLFLFGFNSLSPAQMLSAPVRSFLFTQLSPSDDSFLTTRSLFSRFPPLSLYFFLAVSSVLVIRRLSRILPSLLVIPRTVPVRPR